MTPEPRAQIEEILRRMMVKEYRDEDIREAAGMVANFQTHAENTGLAEEFLASPLTQIRKFGLWLLEAIAPEAPKAAAVLARPEVEALRREIGAGERLVSAPKPPVKPGYEAMADIIRMWVREDKKHAPKKLEDWLPKP